MFTGVQRQEAVGSSKERRRVPCPNLNCALLSLAIAKKRPMIIHLMVPLSLTLCFETLTKNMELYSFIELTNNVVCTSEFETQSWEDREEYLKGSAESSMSGQSIGYTGPQVSAEWDFWSVKGSITPSPNLASS